MTVGVVTDSTAALASEVQAQWNIAVVPLSLTVNGRTIQDGEMSTAEILAAKTYSSASPPLGAFATAIAQQNKGSGVVVITVASTLSSTYQAAVLAAAQTACQTIVVDSHTAAGGQALVALAAARAAQAGASLSEVAAQATQVSQGVQLLGALSNLDQLIRSGRVPDLAGRAGNRLGVRPLFKIQNGAIKKLRPAFSDNAANQRILALWRRTLNNRTSPNKQLHIVCLHADAPQHAQVLLDAINAQVTPVSSFIGSFGQAMIINSGTGVRGLAWYWD